jgi:uncharacterized membrane protein
MKTPARTILGLLVGLAFSASVMGATFQGLGLGAEPNSFASEAAAVSADGSAVAGGYSVTNGGSHAYRWTACTGMVRLDGHHGVAQNGSNAYDVSGNGALVVGFGGVPTNTADAFRWTEAGGMSPLGLWNAVALVASDDGTVILGYGRLNGQFSPIKPFMKVGNGPATTFDFPDYIDINAISRDNSIVVGGSGEADRWTASTGAVPLENLDPNFYQDSSAGDISADGTVIVGISVKDVGTSGNHSGEVHLVTWTGPNNTINDLGTLDPTDGSGAFADGTNADGTIIVGSAVDRSTTTPYSYAFIWDATHGIRRLQDVLTDPTGYNLGARLTGWQLVDATGISDDGKVIVGNGNYTDPNDPNLTRYEEAWIVTLYDTPTLTCGGSNAYYNGVPQTVSLPLSGAAAIECRNSDGSGANNHTFVFGFTDPISSVDSVNTTCGIVASNGVDPNDAHFYLVSVNTAGCNQQYVTVSLTGVHGSSAGQNFALAPDQTLPSASVTAGLLLGDVNGSGRVDAADVSFVRQQTLQPITSLNYRADINGSGRIDAADVSIARQQTLTSLP